MLAWRPSEVCPAVAASTRVLAVMVQVLVLLQVQQHAPRSPPHLMAQMASFPAGPCSAMVCVVCATNSATGLWVLMFASLSLSLADFGSDPPSESDEDMDADRTSSGAEDVDPAACVLELYPTLLLLLVLVLASRVPSFVRTVPSHSAAVRVQSTLSHVSYSSLLPIKKRSGKQPKGEDADAGMGSTAAAASGADADAAARQPLLTEDVLPIPKSLSEIYAVSNKNRRQNKVCHSPVCLCCCVLMSRCARSSCRIRSGINPVIVPVEMKATTQACLFVSLCFACSALFWGSCLPVVWHPFVSCR